MGRGSASIWISGHAQRPSSPSTCWRGPRCAAPDRQRTSGQSRRYPAAGAGSCPGSEGSTPRARPRTRRGTPWRPSYQCREGWSRCSSRRDYLWESTRRSYFEVEGIEQTVRELRARGVVFEEYDSPGLRTSDGIASVDGNYLSTGASGERAGGFATVKETSSGSASRFGDGGVANPRRQ